MHDPIPAHCLRLRSLAEIPRAEYWDGPRPETLIHPDKRRDFLALLRRKSTDAADRANAPVRPRHVTLNVAAWLRVPDVQGKLVSLLVHYRDQRGSFAVLVDEQPCPERGALMLTGCVHLALLGDPAFVEVACSGVHEAPRIVLEELFVQRAADEAPPAAGSHRHRA